MSLPARVKVVVGVLFGIGGVIAGVLLWRSPGVLGVALLAALLGSALAAMGWVEWARARGDASDSGADRDGRVPLAGSKIQGEPHPGDISLGEGRWLRWIDFPSDQARSGAQDIDPWMAGLDDFWDSLETVCQRECCGIDAFDLSPDSIRSAVPVEARGELLGACVGLRQRVAGLPADAFVVSERLNQYLHRDLMLQVIDHLMVSVQDRSLPDER